MEDWKRDKKAREASGSIEKLKNDIKTGEFKSCYLLHGSEGYLRGFYEKKLLKALGADSEDMNTNIFNTYPVDVSEVISQAQTMPFFADRRIVVVRYGYLFGRPQKKGKESKEDDDEGAKKGKSSGAGDDLASLLENCPETTTIVFVEEYADARKKLYKQVAKSGLCIEFVPQTDSYLMQNIGSFLKKADMRISEKDARYLLDIIGSDMGNLNCELGKLVSFAYGRDVITREDIDTICCKDYQDRIFDMIDAIMKKDIKGSMAEYENLLAQRVPGAMIIPMLEKQFLWMLQLRGMRLDGDDMDTIKSKVVYKTEKDPKTGETRQKKGEIGDYQVGKYLEQAAHMEMSELQRAVSLCATADQSFKSGLMSDRVAAEILITRLCST